MKNKKNNCNINLDNSNYVTSHLKNKYKNKHFLNYAFNLFSKKTSDVVGSAWAFCFAILLIIIWGSVGHFFNYSDTWQLIINTGTTIITFLIVFLIQNTQNRDNEILNLKIDELIIAKKGARNHMINLDQLSDVDLKTLEKEFLKLCNKETGK